MLREAISIDQTLRIVIWTYPTVISHKKNIEAIDILERSINLNLNTTRCLRYRVYSFLNYQNDFDKDDLIKLKDNLEY